MDYYYVAGLTIGVEGINYDYFRYRFHGYKTDAHNEPDIIITYKESAVIDTPPGTKCGKIGSRIFLKDGGDFVNYDNFPIHGNVTLVRADSSFRKIHTSLINTEPFGDASLSVRSFNMVGEILKYALPAHDGMVIHASSIRYKNNGILFSAPSGTGKSTHTGLWLKEFPDDTEILNDDMPAVRFINNIPCACGTPYSGKTEINVNKQMPLAAIIFLEQGKTNSIEEISASQAALKLFEQTTLPLYKELTQLTLDHIEQLTESVPFYLLKCRIDAEAVNLVHHTLFQEANI